jgi:hypothetical protein
MSKTRQILVCFMPFLVITILGLLPLLIMMLGGLLASLFGVRLNEAQAPDIPVIGGLLYGMYVIGWLALGTIPLAAVAMMVYTVVFVTKVMGILRQHPPQRHAGALDGERLGR